MNDFILLACPRCGRSDLKARPQHQGRGLCCKRCRQVFRWRPVDAQAGAKPPQAAAADRARVLERERAEAVRDRDEMAARIGALRAELDERADDCRALRAAAPDAARLAAELHEARRSAEAERAALGAEIERLAARVAELEAALAGAATGQEESWWEPEELNELWAGRGATRAHDPSHA